MRRRSEEGGGATEGPEKSSGADGSGELSAPCSEGAARKASRADAQPSVQPAAGVITAGGGGVGPGAQQMETRNGPPRASAINLTSPDLSKLSPIHPPSRQLINVPSMPPLPDAAEPPPTTPGDSVVLSPTGREAAEVLRTLTGSKRTPGEEADVYEDEDEDGRKKLRGSRCGTCANCLRPDCGLCANCQVRRAARSLLAGKLTRPSFRASGAHPRTSPSLADQVRARVLLARATSCPAPHGLPPCLPSVRPHRYQEAGMYGEEVYQSQPPRRTHPATVLSLLKGSACRGWGSD